MTVSRRTILLQGCAIGAGVIAANMTGIDALLAQSMPLRRSLGGMAINDPTLDALRDGVRQLKSSTASAPITWASFSAIHGTGSGFNKCPHRNWYFLPWHRAYLLMYERTIRQLTGHNEFALPYWDWTADRQLPQAFSIPTYNGQPNPLFEPSRAMSPTDSLPDENVGPDVITQIMGDSPFETFGSSRPSGQDSTAAMWVTRTTGAQGTLEGNPHNSVHGIVGGVMATAASPLDPIFVMHHCNIDRIWWVWNSAGNANSADQFWTGMVFQDNYFNPDGSSYSPKVADLFTPEPLGYTYDLGVAGGGAGAGGAGIAVPSLATPADDKVRSLFALPNLTAASLPGIATYTAEVKETATAAKYLEVPVKVGAGAVATVARYRRASSGAEVLDPRGVLRQVASGPRALCFIRDIMATNDPSTQYRVFIDCDYLSSGTPIADPHYVGTFTFFGDHGGHDGHDGANPSVVLDLTRAIQRVYGSQPAPSEGLRVQVLPVRKGKAAEIGTARPGRVEIAFVLT